MSMLADRKQKQRWSLNPRGKLWTEDSSKFGQKMLEKMGWKYGKGLGANEDGITEHVKVGYKSDQKGMGYKETEQWTEHEDNFTQLLKNLNGDSDRNDIVKLNSLQEKAENIKTRINYHKFTKGKDISRYSEKDIANIFGKKSLTPREAKHDNGAVDVKNRSEDVLINRGTISDYFKKKLPSFGRLNSAGFKIGNNGVLCKEADAEKELKDAKTKKRKLEDSPILQGKEEKRKEIVQEDKKRRTEGKLLNTKVFSEEIVKKPHKKKLKQVEDYSNKKSFSDDNIEKIKKKLSKKSNEEATQDNLKEFEEIGKKQRHGKKSIETEISSVKTEKKSRKSKGYEEVKVLHYNKRGIDSSLDSIPNFEVLQTFTSNEDNLFGSKMKKQKKKNSSFTSAIEESNEHLNLTDLLDDEQLDVNSKRRKIAKLKEFSEKLKKNCKINSSENLEFGNYFEEPPKVVDSQSDVEPDSSISTDDLLEDLKHKAHRLTPYFKQAAKVKSKSPKKVKRLDEFRDQFSVVSSNPSLNDHNKFSAVEVQTKSIEERTFSTNTDFEFNEENYEFVGDAKTTNRFELDGGDSNLNQVAVENQSIDLESNFDEILRNAENDLVETSFKTKKSSVFMEEIGDFNEKKSKEEEVKLKKKKRNKKRKEVEGTKPNIWTVSEFVVNEMLGTAPALEEEMHSKKRKSRKHRKAQEGIADSNHTERDINLQISTLKKFTKKLIEVGDEVKTSGGIVNPGFDPLFHKVNVEKHVLNTIEESNEDIGDPSEISTRPKLSDRTRVIIEYENGIHKPFLEEYYEKPKHKSNKKKKLEVSNGIENPSLDVSDTDLMLNVVTTPILKSERSIGRTRKNVRFSNCHEEHIIPNNYMQERNELFDINTEVVEQSIKDEMNNQQEPENNVGFINNGFDIRSVDNLSFFEVKPDETGGGIDNFGFNPQSQKLQEKVHAMSKNLENCEAELDNDINEMKNFNFYRKYADDLLIGENGRPAENHVVVPEGVRLSFKNVNFGKTPHWMQKAETQAKKSYKHLIKGDIVLAFKSSNLHEITGYAVEQH